MGLYRVRETEASAVFGCGHDVTFALADCQLRVNVAICPPCPTCRAVMSVICVPVTERDDAGRRERCVAIHTLHKRVYALGKYWRDAKPEDVRPEMHSLAVDDAVVEAPSARRARG